MTQASRSPGLTLRRAVVAADFMEETNVIPKELQRDANGYRRLDRVHFADTLVEAGNAYREAGLGLLAERVYELVDTYGVVDSWTAFDEANAKTEV